MLLLGLGSSSVVGTGLALVALALWVVVAAYLINAVSRPSSRNDQDFFGENNFYIYNNSRNREENINQ
jgi:hypothetical protein